MAENNIINELLNKLEEIHNQAVLYKDKITKPLYHYTNAEGVKGILESKTVWFSDYTCLNDPGEIAHGIGYICKILEPYKNKYSDISIPLIENFLKEIASQSKFFPIYVCSFCQSADYLPAWRYYGDNGYGFAIEFSSKFCEIEKNIDTLKNKAIIASIFYDDLTARNSQWINHLIQQLFQESQNVFNEIDRLISDNSEKNNLRKSIHSILASHVLTLSPTIKHPDYETEKEYRLFIMESFDQTGKPHLQLDENYFERPELPRKGNKKVLKNIYPDIERCPETIDIPYLKMKLQLDDIQRIYVGPAHNNNFKEIESQLRNCLPKEWSHLKISQSAIQYDP